MSNNGLAKVYSILEKIEYIETIIENSGNITYALEDMQQSSIELESLDEFDNWVDEFSFLLE